MPITMVKSGDIVTIQRITGTDEVRQHLGELGFVTGTEVKVVSNTNGNVIIQIRESRVALDKSMAMRVMVA